MVKPISLPLESRIKSGASRRTFIKQVAATGLVAAVVAASDGRAVRAVQEGTPMTDATPAGNAAPTVFLVHGAFADASGWSEVILRLQAAGIEAIAPANPLRGPAGDAGYLASFVQQIPGPVLLVGHSYGGAVISAAAPQAENVIGLVYVCAYIPEEGESLQALAEQATDSKVGPALRPVPFASADGSEGGVDLYIDRTAFHEVFCADLPAAQAAIMAVSQRPAAAAGFAEPLGPVGWKSLPSWAVISTSDWAIGPSGERFMAERAGAIITEVDTSHVPMMSEPGTVTDVITSALATLA